MAETQLAWQDQRLLSLIREGRVDAEIAVRLGVSTAEVKERVQKLASELGVGGRAGLFRTSALAPRPIVVTPAEGADADPEARIPRGRLRLLPGLTAIAIFLVLISLVTFNTGSRTPARPGFERGDANITLPADPVVPKTGELLHRNGRDVVDAGFVFSVPGVQHAFEGIEQRGEVTRLVFSGRGVFSPAPTEGIDWTGVQVRLYPQTFIYTGTAAGRPVRLHLMAATETTRLEKSVDGTIVVFDDNKAPELLAWVDGFRTEFTASGQLFIDREELPVASAIAYDTGEALDLSNAIPLGFGSDKWNGTFCGEDLRACYVVTRPGPATVPANGELVCADGVLQLTTASARLEFHRLEASGPEVPGCGPFGAAVRVRAGDMFTDQHYRITAFDPQGNQLSIVAARDGTLFVGAIQPLYVCPCRQGS